VLWPSLGVVDEQIAAGLCSVPYLSDSFEVYAVALAQVACGRCARLGVARHWTDAACVSHCSTTAFGVQPLCNRSPLTAPASVQ